VVSVEPTAVDDEANREGSKGVLSFVRFLLYLFLSFRRLEVATQIQLRDFG